MLKLLFDYSITLFAIIDPFVSLVILLSLLKQSNDDSVVHIAFKSSLGVLIGAVVVIILGNLILEFFHVDISAFKIMGGFVLVLLAFQMVQAKVSGTRYAQKETEEALQKTDISIIPLAIPGTLGPGTITTLLIYRDNGSVESIIALFLAVIINCVLLFIILSNARFIAKIFSQTTLNIFTRLMGLLVGSIAIQFIIGGVKSLWLK